MSYETSQKMGEIIRYKKDQRKFQLNVIKSDLKDKLFLVI